MLIKNLKLKRKVILNKLNKLVKMKLNLIFLKKLTSEMNNKKHNY